MFDRLLVSIAPHHCCGCGQKGGLLCDCCKNDVLEERFLQCIFCFNVVKNTNLCSGHSLPYQNGWAVGWREGVLGSLIDELKFKGRREAGKHLAELIDRTLPDVPERVVVVPVPTTHKNIRLRGFDHTRLIADHLAKFRGWQVAKVLARQNNITQHFAASAAMRRRQADSFFKPTKRLDGRLTYLLVDDIYTTGSTIRAAADALVLAGAKHIWIAVAARQKSTKSSRGDSHSPG